MIDLDAEDRLNKANDDLKRLSEHIEQERAVNKEVQRRQAMQLPPVNRNSSGYSSVDVGHVRIKEMIRTLEAHTGNRKICLAKIPFCSSLCYSDVRNKHPESTIRQRPVSQPCTRTETNALLAHKPHRQFGTTTDDAKILSSTKNDSPSLNHSHRSDASIRSITKSVASFSNRNFSQWIVFSLQ